MKRLSFLHILDGYLTISCQILRHMHFIGFFPLRFNNIYSSFIFSSDFFPWAWVSAFNKTQPDYQFFYSANHFFAAMTLNGPKFCWKSHFYQTDRFPEDKVQKMCNILVWCMHKPNLWTIFAITALEFLSCPNPFRLLALLLYLPFTLHVLFGCHKKFGVYHWQSLEMGPWS